jgi:hypothetical protein
MKSRRLRGAALSSLVGALLSLACPVRLRLWTRAGWPYGSVARTSAEAATPARVRLAIAADAVEADRVQTVVRELLGRLSIVVEAVTVDRVDLGELSTGSAGTDAYLARAWVDLRRQDVGILYLVDARRERLVVRQVERPVGGEELAREQIGHILETSCEGLLAGETIGVARADVMPLLRAAAGTSPSPAIAAPTSESTTAPAAWQWTVGAHWGIAALSSEAALTQGPVLSTSVLARPRAGLRFGATLSGQLRLPVEADARTDNGSEGLRLRAWAVRAIATIGRPLGQRVSGRLGVGGGVDVMRAEPRAAADVALLAPARSVRIPIAAGTGAIEYSWVRGVRLGAALTVDVDLSGTEFAFSTASGNRVVLRPWPVRPGLQLGVIW